MPLALNDVKNEVIKLKRILLMFFSILKDKSINLMTFRALRKLELNLL